jgi:hypothetical protein
VDVVDLVWDNGFLLLTGFRGRQKQRQQQIPPLRCGMTNKGAGNDKNNGKSKDNRRGKNNGGGNDFATHDETASSEVEQVFG